jgi:hypothetical protein
MITKQKKIVFVASDGSKFLNETDAEFHERKIAKGKDVSRMKNAILDAIDEPIVDASRMLGDIIECCYAGFDNARGCVIDGEDESVIVNAENGVEEVADGIVEAYLKNPEATTKFFGAIYDTLKK